MVTKLIQFIHREVAGIHQAAYVLGVFALSSQLLGLLRDRLLAGLFGASRTLDVYYAAFRIPDLLFLTVASIVSLSVLLPFFVERLERDRETAKIFLDRVFSIFFLTVSVLSIVAFFAMPYVLPLIFPGFAGSDLAQAISLSRLLLLSPILLGISNLLAAVTQAHQRFLLYAISPLLYNLGIIAGGIAVFFEPSLGITGVVYGVLFGAVLHLVVQVPFVISKGFLPRFTFSWNTPEIWRVLFYSAPRRIALSINHIAIIFLISIASLMAEGSIAIFQFSFNLQSVSLSIIGASYSVAAFPALTRLFAKGDMQTFLQQFTTAARHIVFWALPLTALFIVLRAQIVRTILGSGSFDWADTRLTAAALALFIISLVFQALMLLFVRGYFAVGNTRTPFLINITSGAVMVVSAFGLWYLFEASVLFRTVLGTALRVTDLDGIIVLVLPLAYTLGFLLNGVLLWFWFERDFGHSLKGVFSSFWQSLAGAVLTGLTAYGSLQVLSGFFDLNTFLGIFLQGACAGLVGASAGLGVLWLLGSSELNELWSSLSRRFGRKNVVASGTDTLEN
ncbi:MAG: lipid II flippase MurJ [Candidatus Paceibacterota bacterium]